MDGRSLNVTPSTSSGLFAQPQKRSSPQEKASAQKDASPIALIQVTEFKAKDGIIEMLTEKCTKLQMQLDKAKALRAALHEQVEQLTLERDDVLSGATERDAKKDKEINEGNEQISQLQAEVERLKLQLEAAEASVEPTRVSLATTKEKLATERHKRELAEMILARERRQFAEKEQQLLCEIEAAKGAAESRRNIQSPRPQTANFNTHNKEERNLDAEDGMSPSDLDGLLQERDERIEELMQDLEAEREWRITAQKEKAAIEASAETLRQKLQQKMNQTGQQQMLHDGKEAELQQLRELVETLQAAHLSDQERIEVLKRKSKNLQAKAKVEVFKEKDERIQELENKIADYESKFTELKQNANERVKKYKSKVEELKKQVETQNVKPEVQPGSREIGSASSQRNRKGHISKAIKIPVKTTKHQVLIDEPYSPSSSAASARLDAAVALMNDTDIPEWMRY